MTLHDQESEAAYRQLDRADKTALQQAVDDGDLERYQGDLYLPDPKQKSERKRAPFEWETDWFDRIDAAVYDSDTPWKTRSEFLRVACVEKLSRYNRQKKDQTLTVYMMIVSRQTLANHRQRITSLMPEYAADLKSKSPSIRENAAMALQMLYQECERYGFSDLAKSIRLDLADD